MAGSERLHRGFLCRKTPGKVRDRISSARTIGNLAFGEHAAQKTLAISFEGRGNPGNVCRIEPESEDVHGSAPA